MVWTTKPPAGTQLDFTNPINNGLVGCWIFNEGSGTVVNDLSGNGNNGTLRNITEPSTQTSGWNPGKNGQPMLTFDGIDDYINIPHSSTLNLGDVTDSYSISFWIKTAQINDVFFFIKQISSATIPYYFYLTSNKIEFKVYDGSIISTVTTTQNINDYTWHNVIGIRDKTSNILKIYVDGYLSNLVNDITIINTQNTSPIVIGSYLNGRFNGSFDEFRIWNRVLAESEISLLSNPTTTYSMFINGCPPLSCSLNIM